MTSVITSAYDKSSTLTVDQMMSDPTFIPQRIVDGLNGAFVEDLFFRPEGSNAGVVAFREAAATVMADEAEDVAEFGEIPVSDPRLGDLKSAYAIKTALAARFSYEQRTENRVDSVNQEITALQKSVVLSGYKASSAALKAAGVPELVIDTPWSAGGDVATNLFDAIEMVQGANDGHGGQYDYAPDTILLHPRALTAAVRNEKMNKFYVGNAALENPIFKGLKDIVLAGELRVATSRLIPVGEAYVFEQGAPGFLSNTIPLQATPLYCEGGESPLGGPTMSWRTDVVRKRAIGVDNPKSVVKLKGVIA